VFIADSRLIGSAKSFVTVLLKALESSNCNTDLILSKKPILFFMYFDEAHTLTEEESVPGSPPFVARYDLLGRILGKMNDLPFFNIFLSTKTLLGAVAPPSSSHPSIRDWSNVTLHAPFTELPFDAFAVESFTSLLKTKSHGVKLQDVCALEYVVKFGRPL
jgi:hypothetical protein